MPNILKILRSITPGSRPSGRTYGELYANFGDNQLGVFDSSNIARDLIGVPMFSSAASYSPGNPVVYQGALYVALVAISAGAFNPGQWASISTQAAAVTPWSTGDAKLTYKKVADSGWIIVNDGSIGDATSGGTTRANADTQNLWTLFYNNISRNIPLTCTISIASPAVITVNNHPFSVNQRVVFSTTGALPTGITAGTSYYIISAGFATNSFRIATAPGGTAINTSGTQSGVHTVTGYFELVLQDSTGVITGRGASASADFGAHKRLLIPVMLGRALVVGGAGSGLTARYIGEQVGGETVTQIQANVAAHTHGSSIGGSYVMWGVSGSTIDQNLNNVPINFAGNTGSIGSGSPMNIMQPSSFLNVMVCL